MRKKLLKIFFSGIGGSGMSAIASFMAEKGHTVVGSDRAFDIGSHPLKDTFQSRGIAIVPQDGSGIDKTLDLAVFSTAVESDRPEMKKVKALGIPMKTRPEYLIETMRSFQTIAVSGTSGKSTTSGLLAFIMKKLNLNPNFIGGGRVKQFRTPSNPGNYLAGKSDYLIAEACESDGTIVNFTPHYTMILNVALDHHPVNTTAKMFKSLIKKTGKRVILNTDDTNLRKLKRENTVTFSIYTPSHYKADAIVHKPFSTDFVVRDTAFRVLLPGQHNLYNALSCISLLSELGIPLHAIAEVLPEFQGIDRRFDILLNDGTRLVIDDYAHNPHKIASLMETVRQFRERICYIFQPHGFKPTQLMKNGYVSTFVNKLRDSDHLVLLPIFYSGGSAIKDISSHDIAKSIKRKGKSVEAVGSREDLLKKLHEYKTHIIFGARDESLSDLARAIAHAPSFAISTGHKHSVRADP